MDKKLAISLLIIGVSSIIDLVYHFVKRSIKSEKCSKKLRSDILTNVGVDIDTLNLNNETCFVVSEKANNTGLNHCDIEFDSDLHTLNERTYNHEFISTFAKDKI